MIRPGRPERLGATPGDGGTNFAVFSSVAEALELCLFDAAGHETEVYELPECTDGVWHGFLPGCLPGQRYGFRVRGSYEPEAGMRCNRSKLLLDPYARRCSGVFRWHDAVFDSNALDSAAYVPHGIVTDAADGTDFERPGIDWADTIFYEVNVRGYTIRHPALEDADRGTFQGMRHRAILDYLRSLGITSIELMPVHAFLDERHLFEKGLRNFWGYNTFSFFIPANRYSRHDGVTEFRDMVRAIHDAGMEVILDVAYNHTAEGGSDGPSICFRGLDNLAYYRTEPDDPGCYINDTGCGNTLNADHPRVRDLVLESLRYWHNCMGVDGFRFDLAPVLGRHANGFSSTHPLLATIGTDAGLQNAKLIAEPWDPGPGGYQLGNFPPRWAEWNDRFRDAARRFWRGDQGMSGELAKRLRGSADLFEASGRRPSASVNFVTCHDGFTLSDVVSYEHRHNEANGERNRDGHAHNFSNNFGVEGPSDDAAVLAARRTQRLNLLATVFLSQGTPLLLGGDEFGNSQFGNNNAYAQDNDAAWIDWSDLDTDAGFTEEVRNLIRLRREFPLLRADHYLHGQHRSADEFMEIAWTDTDGNPVSDRTWERDSCFAANISRHGDNRFESAVFFALNGSTSETTFALPTGNRWRLTFRSSNSVRLNERSLLLPGGTLAILVNANRPGQLTGSRQP